MPKTTALTTAKAAAKFISKGKDALTLAAFAGLLAVPAQTKVNLAAMNSAPSFAHPLGTDNLGRDLLARLSEAIGSSVLPLWLAVLSATILGIMCALAAVTLRERLGHGSRTVFLAFDGVMTMAASIPVTITTFAWAACMEQAGLRSVLLSLSAVFWVRGYLTTKDLVRHDEALGYWTAHKALGGTLFSRLWGYGVREAWLPSLIACLGLHLRAAVAVEASLSYLGFGAQEPTASFGNMLAAHFDSYLKGHWSVLIMTVMTLALTAAAPSAFARLLASGPKRSLRAASATLPRPGALAPLESP